jgi:hypothetical protein
MPRRVKYFEAYHSGLEHVAVVQVAVERYDGRRFDETNPARLQSERVIERQIGRMKQSAPRGQLAEPPDVADVIDMSMRVYEQLRMPVVLA